MKNLRKRLSIPKDEANRLKENWANCLPGELSKLFYSVPDGDSRNADKVNSFDLSQNGINGLLEHGEQVKVIRIYMGCSEDHQFTPIFTIVKKDQTEINYELIALKSSIEEKTGGSSFVQITHSISSLFQRKWAELNNEEVSAAFSGLTCSKIVQKTESQLQVYDGSFVARRVKSYDFLTEDVKHIIANLKGVEKTLRKVQLLLGAGLTVHVTHPFNFRPILAVSSMHLGPGMTASNEDGPPYDNNYERSKPCPPFCNDDDGVGI